ncbi:MAG: hypothetical protein JW769_04110 [Parachlamydiales bacterium]|nr:hypothetical protein [Parachlamydiales bacterium]
MLSYDLPPPSSHYVEIMATLPAFYKGTSLLAAIKIHKDAPSNVSYADLPAKKEDVQKIYYLITTTGGGSWKKLWSDRKRLYKIGDEIRYIHPLKFLGIIYSNNDLKPHMLSIVDHYFKRTNFIKDLASAMELELSRNNIDKYLDDFSEHIKVPKEIFSPYIQRKDWAGLLRTLAEY